MAINRQHWTETRTDEKIEVKTPSYYDGENTACTYILRAYKKHEQPNEDIQKAIDHLQFELNKLKK